MLAASDLRKAYGGRTVVRDFGFSLEQGEVVGLLGPNGAGKTTCFYMVVGLVAVDSGTIRLDDRDITELPMHERARLGVGYLPQEASVFRRLTVAQNVMAILELRKDLDRAPRSELETCSRTADRDIADSRGVSLSGGERRRVEITRALASKPLSCCSTNRSPHRSDFVVDIQRIVRQLRHAAWHLITDHNVRETLASVIAPTSEWRSVDPWRPGRCTGQEQSRGLPGREFRISRLRMGHTAGGWTRVPHELVPRVLRQRWTESRWGCTHRKASRARRQCDAEA